MDTKLSTILKSVCKLATPSNAGSGVFISPNRILTTQHNISSALAVYADLEGVKEIRHPVYCDVFDLTGSKNYLSTIIAYDTAKDIALLELKDHKVKDYSKIISEKEIENCNIFDDLYIIGAGADHDPLPTNGILTYKKEKVGYEFHWMTNAPITTGDSGGGVFKKIKNTYYLIGIITSMGIDSDSNQIVHMTDFIPPLTLHEFLEKANG